MLGSGTVQLELVKTFYTNFNRHEMRNMGLIGNLGVGRNSFFQNFSIDIRHLTEINITVALAVTVYTFLEWDLRGVSGK
jgi:hypothetical protein